MRRKTLLLFAALAVLTAACGGSHKKAAAPATSTSGLPTTTTAPPVYPLTGAASPDAKRLHRPALVVKIDNAPQALPQAGINQADVVFEEQVEGGITRFAAVFQSQDADPVGPVRSTRSTDVAIVSMLNHPLYAFSGGNTVFLNLIRSSPILDVGDDVQPQAYIRAPGRQAPHNLMSNTSVLYGLVAKNSGPPQPLFTFRAAGAAPTGAGAAPDTHLSIAFPGAAAPNVTWDWDAGSQTWKRGQSGGADNDASGQQIATNNVIVEFVPYHDTGLKDPAHNPVPEAELVGQGDAAVFTAGMIIRGHWSKPDPGSPTTYTDAAGQPIALTPGRTWIELPSIGTATQSS